MRDIAVLLIFAGALPFAVRYTWAGVLLWTWISVMNPHRLGWGFVTHAPLAMLAALATMLSLLIGADRKRMPNHPAVLALVAFVLWMGVTTLVSMFPEPSQDFLVRVLKIQLMTLVAAAAIRERRHIEAFIWVNALSIGFYGIKGGIFTLKSGGGERVWGPPGGFIEGNNEIGLAIVIAIPLLNYLRMRQTRRWLRHALTVSMLLSAVAVLGTHSRGAFLAIAAMTLLLWWRSERRLSGGIVLAATAVTMLAFMPENWTARMRSIETYDQDSSALGRLNAWSTAINIANDRFFGAGFAMYDPAVYARYAPHPEIVRAAHSIYFQVLGEHGWIGLGLFLTIGWLTWRECARIRRETRGRPEVAWVHDLTGMLQVSMIGFAVGGAFLSLSYFDLPYNLMVVVVALRAWLDEKRWHREAPGGLTAGPAKPPPSPPDGGVPRPSDGVPVGRV